jgi:hypothetical protein
MHAVSIEAGGIVPLPRVGGALSHAVGSIRNLPRHCQTGVASTIVKELPTRDPRINNAGIGQTQLAFNSGDLAFQEIIMSRPRRESATRLVSQNVIVGQ